MGRLCDSAGLWVESPELEVQYDDFGRWYKSPVTALWYPSITTALKVLSRDGIQQWREKIGAEEADAITAHAGERGTMTHDLLESWCLGQKFKEATPEVEFLVNQILPLLNKHVSRIYAVETQLYSDRLALAGRCDLIADWDGVPSVIDFKTARKVKRESWVQGYFQQACFYSVAFWQMYHSVRANQLVVVIANDAGVPQHFEKPVSDYYFDLQQTRAAFEEWVTVESENLDLEAG